MGTDNEKIKAACMMIDLGEFSRHDIAKQFGISKSYLDKLYRERNGKSDDSFSEKNILDNEEVRLVNKTLMLENEELKKEVEKLKNEIKTGLSIADYQAIYKLNTEMKAEIERLEKELAESAKVSIMSATPVFLENAKEITLENVQKNKIENVNHPKHYGGDTIYEAIKVIEAWELGFCLGNAVKYISRAGKKDKTKTVEDLKKAMWYINREINKQLEIYY